MDLSIVNNPTRPRLTHTVVKNANAAHCPGIVQIRTMMAKTKRRQL